MRFAATCSDRHHRPPGDGRAGRRRRLAALRRQRAVREGGSQGRGDAGAASGGRSRRCRGDARDGRRVDHHRRRRCRPDQLRRRRPIRRLGPTDPVRDAADLAITRAAVDSNVPTLATCRGIQVLNVAMGGTLVQHVDEHMRVDMYNEDVHDVDIDPASRLATILGTAALGVNSMHHQVIDRLGAGVRAVAHNHDGHIEAIEIDAAPAVLGCAMAPGTAAPSRRSPCPVRGPRSSGTRPSRVALVHELQRRR